MKTVSDLVKLSFYDSVAKENVNIVELEELQEVIKILIDENGLVDDWVLEFFEIEK